ncbi:WD40 repeat domain-containing protein [Brucella grignonensis]|uniref:Anaphase-promoting complex subunit 4 WD40 domain protein n=1 Tax=Brucella grignonensis TaxID=94627 RepID=A0A256F0K2_9HYPH|nr:WD40 repeat domain-containing protein [Brucella grignonensis]OYR08367.1 anaphase-promoting complex subunit 4 WD40 domain protein [Brucella grignonensis]
MNQQTVPSIALFDLLARKWRRSSAIRHMCFNEDNTLLAIVSDDGSVALARMADNEPPDARVSVNGSQITIAPRQGKPAPLIVTRVKDGEAVSTYRNGGFLAAGEVNIVHLSRTGEILETVLSSAARLMAFDHCLLTGATAYRTADRLFVHRDGDWSAPLSVAHEGGGQPERIAFSKDGAMLAAACTECLIVYRIMDTLQPLLRVPLSAEPLSLKWSDDGSMLASSIVGKGLLLLEIASSRHVFLDGFPGQVRDVTWATETILASGAFRIAAWSMKTPPFDDRSTGALATGRTGLVLVEAVAAQPKGRLVAAGYANGQVVVSSLGTPAELVVRSAGGPVTSLQWTLDGRHLAIGDALGDVAIVSFPQQMFK